MHSLALPLSEAYQHDSQNGYSFFTSANAAASSSALNHFLDDLVEMLRRTRLLQSHPDEYFHFVRGESWREPMQFFDGSRPTTEELHFTEELLEAFTPLLSGPDALAKLRVLVRDGPSGLLTVTSPAGSLPSPPSSSSSLSLSTLPEFYAATRRLMLSRQRRPDDDAASVTLLPPAAQRCRAAARERQSAVAKRQHQQRILQLVVSHGMNLKKQHEVSIMRNTIHDLVDCCNDGGAEARGQPLVRTVVNIGEGKGYVSRALALCDDLQVVGLDCNPAHKERAVERFESLLDSSLTQRDVKPQDAPPLNLLYEPRGHIASIACRVDESVDWTELLRGHVVTAVDGDAVDGGGGNSTDGLGAAAEMESFYEAQRRNEEVVKLACRFCGKVVRQECIAIMMKHIYIHLGATRQERAGGNEETEGVARSSDAVDSTAQEDAATMMPTAAQVEEWNRTLSQHAYVAQMIERFFTRTDVEKRHGEQRRHREREAAASKRSRSSETDAHLCLYRRSQPLNDANSSCSIGASTGPGEMNGEYGAGEAVVLVRAHTARGHRVLLLLPVREAVPGGEEEGKTSWVYRQISATIVGFDGGVDAHHVLVDGEARRRTVKLFRLPATHSIATHLLLSADEVEFPPASLWATKQVALLLSVRPPTLPSTPTVLVPSLSNTILIGLHPCGDLGSNVCRIFRRSAARGLLLVSCCWHALTSDGFPMSVALQRRGLTVNSISLLLATQPLDAWSTASPEGHRSSAKVLFFRSILKLWWAELKVKWDSSAARRGSSLRCIRATTRTTPAVAATAAAPEERDSGSRWGCALPSSPPHLEPALLRRFARRKETLTLVEFLEETFMEYALTDTAKTSEFTLWSVSDVCANCRAAQEAFLGDAVRERSALEAMEAFYLESHFARFLGLTVLRMWVCHLVELLLLLDRAFYLHEQLSLSSDEDSGVSLVPLFDGALSPRMYGILARRGGAARSDTA